MFEIELQSILITEIENRWQIQYNGQFFRNDFENLKHLPERELVLSLVRIGLVNSGHNCVQCGTYLDQIQFAEKRHPFVRYSRRGCSRSRISIYKNTIFDNVKFSVKKYWSCFAIFHADGPLPIQLKL